MTEHASRTGRTRPALATLASAILLALLWLLRPPLPHTEPATGAWSATTITEAIALIAWVLLTLATLRRSYQALRKLVQQPSRRRLAETERLRRVLATPASPQSPPRPYKRYRPPLKLGVGQPLVDADGNGHVDPGSNAQAQHADHAPNASSEASIRVSLLGPFKLDGVEHRPGRGACEQLIAYLALHPRGATRDQLIEAIWPDEDPHKTRHRLYQNISETRQLLGDALISKRAHYTLDRHKLTVDVDELETLLVKASATETPRAQRPTLERALQLFRGEPLAGWDYLWADADVRRLRSTHTELLERTGHARLVTGDASGALEAAQQGLALDGLNEGLWRLAMQAEGRLGLRESVGHRYQQLRRMLDEQPGLEPEGATRALYHELLGQR